MTDIGVPNFRIEKSAIGALQEAAEAAIVSEFKSKYYNILY